MDHLIDAATLRSRGLTRNDIRDRLRAGLLLRVRRGVYSTAVVTDPALALGDRLRAALHTNPGAVVSHRCAAWLHGLPIDLPPALTLSRNRRGCSHQQSDVRMRVAQLPADHITEIDGIAVTCLARTIADLGRTEPLTTALIAADAAARSGLLAADLTDLLDYATGWPGVVRARELPRLMDARSESPGESVSRLRMDQWGLPKPDLQREFWCEGHLDRVDFYWEEFDTVGEFDGRTKYEESEAGRRTLWKEKLREDRLRRSHRGFIRWTYADLWEPTSLPVRLAALLR